MKKIILRKQNKNVNYALILSMIIVNFSFAAPAKAVGETLTIGSQSASNESLIVIPITGDSISVASDIFGIQFRVNYDNTLLEYTGYTGATIGATIISNAGDYINVVWDSDTVLELDGENFVSLNFNVISSNSTDVNITFSNTEAVDSVANPVAVSFIDGVITLNPDETAPTLSQVTPVPTPTNDNTPDYIFNTNEAGTISYSGDCASATTDATEGDNTITFNTLTEGTHGGCTITVTDSNDNTSAPLVVNTFTVDTTPPTGTIAINGGATHTNSRNVTLTLSATDALSEVVEMRIANGTSYLSWESYATSKAWTLTAEDGSKTVRVQFKDQAGNETSPGIATDIILDASAPAITLSGDNPITIEVGSTYNDAGATAADAVDGDITDDIITVNPVETDIIGTYTITYNVTDSSGNPAAEVTRTVNVVDTTVPVIILLGDNPVNVEVGYEYNDAGATASDNYDGDITVNIITVNPVDVDTEGSYTVTYNITDSSENSAEEVTRTVNITSDVTLPVITLNGGDMNIYQGTSFMDPGATAVDNIDGVITPIVISGDEVDSSTVGTYIIIYNISDSAGNPAIEATRTVNVLAVEATEQILDTETTVTSDFPNIVVGSANTASSTVTIPENVADAILDVSALTTSDAISTTAIIAGAITINASTSVGQVDIEMPANIKIIANISTWDGTIKMPQVQSNSSVTATPDAGNVVDSVDSVIEVGFSNVKLVFDKAVKILIPGQAGKSAGYSVDGTDFTTIAVCTASQLADPNTLPAEGECKTDIGGDLVIWTKHFTNFIAYTQSVAPSPAPASSGGSFVVRSPESSSVVINNNNATTTSNSVTISLSATKMTQSYAPLFVRISNESDMIGADWIAYATEFAWTLAPGTGTRTVYAQFRNKEGMGGMVSDSIEVVAGGQEVPKEEDAQVPLPQVLGEKEYADGTLIRGSDKKIYILQNSVRKHISSLAELAAHYAGQEIFDVSDDVLASYAQVAGEKGYGVGQLIRGSDMKVYVVELGGKRHVLSLEELARDHFRKQIFDIADSVLAQY